MIEFTRKPYYIDTMIASVDGHALAEIVPVDGGYEAYALNGTHIGNGRQKETVMAAVIKYWSEAA